MRQENRQYVNLPAIHWFCCFPAPFRRLAFIGLMTLLIGLPILAKPQGKKKTTKPRPAASAVLPGGQQCDGALEVIPRTELTFTRKRRPSPVTDKQ